MMYIDMMRQMKVAMETCLHVKPGEEILIVSDTQTSDDLKNGLMAAVQSLGAEAQLLVMTTRIVANQEVPKTMAAAILQADKTIELTSLSMNHTRAVKAATEAGKVILNCPMLTEELVIRTWPTSLEELEQLKARTNRMREIIDSSKQARLTSPEGTDITVGVGKYPSFWDYGIVERPGITSIPGGQTGTCPVEGSANGKYVIDVSTGFPGYRSVREPITCIVKDGNVVELKGGRDADELRRYLEGLDDPNCFHIAELGTGTNPRCKFTGNPHDDEKKAGSVRLAVGTDITFGGKTKAKTHIDGMMSHVTLQLDDRVIIKNGEIVV